MLDDLTWLPRRKSNNIYLNHSVPEIIGTVVEFPLQYICFSRLKIISPTNKMLYIEKNYVTFKCSINTKLRTGDIKINFDKIVKLRYSKDNCVLSMELTKEYYEELFSKNQSDDTLFHNTIWFCLGIKNKTDYSKKLSILTNQEVLSVQTEELSTDCLQSLISLIKATPFSQAIFINNFKETKSSDNLPDNVMYVKKRKQVDPSDTPKRKKFVYSPSPSYSIEITSTDLTCLKPGSYINDNIINLYISYICHEILTLDQRQRTHFFNCFFNTKLIGTRLQQRTDTPASRHARVAKWTKNVDLFEKDFLILPVIEAQHWFLVIVCFPWMAGMVDYAQLMGTSKSPSLTIPPNQSVFATKDRVEKLARIKAEQSGYEPMPCILIFDSLTTAMRTDKVNIIRDYLKTEWDTRRATTDGALIFDKNTTRGYSPKVPQQNNSTDCGVYLLNYVEMFFKKPITQFTFEYFKNVLIHWFGQSDVDKKRQQIKETIVKIVKKSPDVESNE